ncbi:MAG TPA: CPBP family intramembrane glutamic endopeptidase [Candidatus Dormibacteraeota bacterium]|nr:CPBP family intramembrane glutamic endopeptidase [Candidatus Dormibacteraeota bacterium]
MTVSHTRTVLLWLGAVGQGIALRWGFHNPSRFWPLVTAGLVGSGLLVGPRREESPQQPDRRWVAVGAAAGLGAFGLTALVSVVVARVPIGRRWLAEVGASTGAVSRPAAAALVVPCALAEELFWREGVLSRTGTAQSWTALCRHTVAYAAVQGASLNPLPVCGGVLLGALTGLLRQRSGSLLPALAAHLVYSELTLVVPGLPAQRSPRDTP